MIYFDNAATSLPKPKEVIEAVSAAMSTLGGVGRGGHGAALAAGRCAHAARKKLAQLLGADADRTVFTSNATESLNAAIFGLLTERDHAITTALEHNSVLRPLYLLRGRGMGLSVVQADQNGEIDTEDFKKYLRPDTKAVVCTHASNLTGYMPDVEAIGKFCSENGLILILDAAQTAGAFPIDMQRMNVGILCFTGHKSLLGPQGTGGICLRGDVELSPLKVGGSGIYSFDERHPGVLPEALEAGTINAHGIAGLLAGVELIQETGIDRIHRNEQELARRFCDGAEQIPGVKLYGGRAQPRAPIVALNLGDADSALVADRLYTDYGICTRAGGHCAPLLHRALGTEKQGAVRFSFSYFNTADEIDAGIRAVAELAGEFCG